MIIIIIVPSFIEREAKTKKAGQPVVVCVTQTQTAADILLDDGPLQPVAESERGATHGQGRGGQNIKTSTHANKQTKKSNDNTLVAEPAKLRYL